MKKIAIISAIFIISCIFACGDDMVEKGLISTLDPRLPEINIKQGSNDIFSDEGTGESIYDVTDDQIINSGATIIFTIENLGTSDLELSGSPLVAISGINSYEFIITEEPDSIIESGRNTTFTLSFEPYSVSGKTAIISIENNDFDESPYTFTITGSTYADISINQEITDIPSGGSFSTDNIETIPFTIKNIGNYNLELTGDTPVVLSGADADEFEITDQPAAVIEPGGDSIFRITFAPTSVGSKTATITIDNNDFDESSYSFAITGSSYAEISINQVTTDIPSNGGFTINDVEVNETSSAIPFTIKNTGTYDLELTGIAPVVLSGIDADEFAIIQQPAAVIGPGGDSIFRIIFSPLNTDQKTADIIIATNDFDESVFTFTITAISKPIPDFSARLRKGIGSLSVTFENRSEGGNTEWAWDFDNDGIVDSTDQNPTYKYNSTGTYSVKLAVNGLNGPAEIIKARYIEIIEPIKYTIDNYFDRVSSVTPVDLDEDGDIDVVGASSNDDNSIADLVWWDNINGNGTSWGKNIIVSDFNSANSIIPIDINGDTSSDLLALSGSEIAWWENDGSGTFSEVPITSYNGGKSIFAAQIDSTTDSYIDVISCRYGSDRNSAINWWSNADGLGNFGSINEINDGTDFEIPHSIIAAYIDDDDYLDVIGASYSTDEIAWWKNTDGSFGLKQTVDATFDGAESVFVEDIDGDGINDIIGAAKLGDEIAWWKNDGSGDSWEKQTIAENFSSAESVYAADIDGDNDLDVLGASRGADRIAWWENDDSSGERTWTSHIVDDNFDGANSVSAGDFDGDGNLDILGSAYFANHVTWWRIKKELYENIIDDNFGGISVFTADLDNDGDLDIIGADSNSDDSPDIIWWERSETGTYVRNTLVTDFNNANYVYAADIDGDGNTDILSSDFDSKGAAANEIVWWRNNGDRTFGTKQIICSVTNAISIFASDIDGDGDMDIISASGMSGILAWWENDGTGNFPNSGTEYPTGSMHTLNINPDLISLYVEDMNNNGEKDIVCAADNTDASDDLILWTNDGSGSFTSQPVASDFDRASYIYISDINGDEEKDIVSTRAGETSYWENDGSENFTEHTVNNATGKEKSVYAADLNGDGKTDILELPGSSTKMLWWVNDGTLPDDSSIWVNHKIESIFYSATANGVRFADIDNDGDIDILLTSDSENKIIWIENNIINFGPE